MLRRAFVIACVLACAGVARAQSSPVMEWPPRPPPDMAQPPPPPSPPDMAAPPSPGDLAVEPKPPAATVDGGATGNIKTLDVPPGTDTHNLGDVITDVKIVDNTRTDSETVRYIA